MAHSSAFWDRIANRYSKKPIADEDAYRKKLALTRQYLRPDMQALEIGCGTGSTAIEHAGDVGHLHATDISAKMLAIAEKKAAAKKIGNLSFEQADIDDLEIADGSLDAVLAMNLLHLLEDRDAAIAAVHRMLKPRGVFVSNTACLGDKMKFFKYLGPVGRFLGLIPLVRVFTVQELVDSLSAAGFRIDQQWQPNGPAVYIVAIKRG